MTLESYLIKLCNLDAKDCCMDDGELHLQKPLRFE